jgi:hypothetical protein
LERYYHKLYNKENGTKKYLVTREI